MALDISTFNSYLQQLFALDISTKKYYTDKSS